MSTTLPCALHKDSGSRCSEARCMKMLIFNFFCCLKTCNHESAELDDTFLLRHLGWFFMVVQHSFCHLFLLLLLVLQAPRPRPRLLCMLKNTRRGRHIVRICGVPAFDWKILSCIFYFSSKSVRWLFTRGWFFFKVRSEIVHSKLKGTELLFLVCLAIVRSMLSRRRTQLFSVVGWKF